MNRTLSSLLLLAGVFASAVAASGQVSPDSPLSPKSRAEVLEEIIRNKQCALREDLEQNIREMRSLVSEDGVSRSPAEALRISRSQTYLLLAVQEGIRDVLSADEEYTTWARQQEANPEIVDYNDDEERPWDALKTALRWLAERNPAGRAFSKVMSGAEKANEKLIELDLKQQFEEMVRRGEARKEELRELHDGVTEKLIEQRRRRERISELVAEREAVEKTYYRELEELSELRRRLSKFDLRRDLDGEDDFGAGSEWGEEYRKLRECPACWNEDWDEKVFRHLECTPDPPATPPDERPAAIPELRVTSASLEYISGHRFRPVWKIVEARTGKPIAPGVALSATQTRTLRDEPTNTLSSRVELQVFSGGLATYNYFWGHPRNFGDRATYRWTLRVGPGFRLSSESVDTEVRLD